MGKQFDSLSDDHRNFIAEQKIFFVGSAAESGKVNISPKGGDSLRILGDNRIIWRNLTGSGNETAGHLARVNRMTLMWCGFETRPMILRCYGTAKVFHARDPEFDDLNGVFDEHVGARQIYDMTVDMVQTSCGYAVPFYDYREDRKVLDKWAEGKGRDGVGDYWRDRNQETLDGFPTHVIADDA
ncbi:pyridoxamine 5'-phosphate oxidase family protein [Tropicibacter sp. R15_0]|uniref:pyridoxamine 5'-phosphate oxidase family protein n=1 Tax=Tropicibacter sp. R15_0 TaxID=2821101 RepID=UPI001ADA5259|nr:pyridoxamine 5'-phosphate oxidase family protein [Tropicibacter sp. R15_0]MBO9464439.1 pyridoxamine 5'-phosphate oxidase family protein [Tropicibacter sp. R15_0]